LLTNMAPILPGPALERKCREEAATALNRRLTALLMAGWLTMAWASGMFLASGARIDGKDRASSAVIAPDWLGLGDTEVSLEDDYRLPRDVELLTGLMKHLQIERAKFVAREGCGIGSSASPCMTSER
jgi:pimeloyl-ACP methyl ester carboxylesterase